MNFFPAIKLFLLKLFAENIYGVSFTWIHNIVAYGES